MNYEPVGYLRETTLRNFQSGYRIHWDITLKDGVTTPLVEAITKRVMITGLITAGETDDGVIEIENTDEIEIIR